MPVTLQACFDGGAFPLAPLMPLGRAVEVREYRKIALDWKGPGRKNIATS